MKQLVRANWFLEFRVFVEPVVDNANLTFNGFHRPNQLDMIFAKRVKVFLTPALYYEASWLLFWSDVFSGITES